MTKPPTIGICSRCNRIVLAGTEGGRPATVDMTPLDVDGYRAALIGGRRLYRLVQDARGRPAALQPCTTAWDSTKPLLAAHGCPNAAVRPLAAVSDHPCPVPATPGPGAAGRHPHPAPAAGTTPSTAATTAARHRSKTCGYIVAGKPCGTDGRQYGFGGIRCQNHLPSTTRKADIEA